MSNKEIDILIRRLKGKYIDIVNDEYKFVTIKSKDNKKGNIYFQIWSYLPLVFSLFFFKKSLLISGLLMLFFIILRYVDFSSKKSNKLSKTTFDLESKKIIFQNHHTEYSEEIIETKDISEFMTTREKVTITINSSSTAYFLDLKCKTKANETKSLMRIVETYESDLLKKERALLKFLNILKEE